MNVAVASDAPQTGASSRSRSPCGCRPPAAPRSRSPRCGSCRGSPNERSAPARTRCADEAGFTLIEVLMATLLMTVILGALATVTAQWLPNWNRGMARVQRAERLAIGLERIAADLSVAEMMPINGDAKAPLFEGSELSVTFVRTAVGPNTPARPRNHPPDREGRRSGARAGARARARSCRCRPMRRSGLPIRSCWSAVAVSRTFSYAGPDQVWQNELARPKAASGHGPHHAFATSRPGRCSRFPALRSFTSTRRPNARGRRMPRNA